MSGMQMQDDLLKAKVVSEDKVTEAGAGKFYYLTLGDKAIPLGIDAEWAHTFYFSIVRNAEAFENQVEAK